MKMKILAATAMLAMAIAGPALAAPGGRTQPAQQEHSATSNRCGEILANPGAHASSDVQYCQGQGS